MVPSMRGGGGDYMQRRTPEAKGKIENGAVTSGREFHSKFYFS